MTHQSLLTVGAGWKKWKRLFELFVVGKGVQNAAPKKVLLFHCGGPQMQDVYYTFPEAQEPGEGETVYTAAMEQVDQYFMPQVNVPYERHLFRTIAQLPAHERAEYCEFSENIRDQVVKKCVSKRLQRKILEKGRELTLEQLQNTARSMEASDRQAGASENPNDKEGLKEGLNSVQEKTEGKRCYRCDLTGHTQDDKRCPARDKECRKCHKVGHFAKCCKT